MLNPKQSYKAYSKTDVNTSDQLTLIIMLYEGLLRFLKKAMIKIEENDVEAAHNYFVRSKDIVNELINIGDNWMGEKSNDDDITIVVIKKR